ncbi:MAG: GatB/YqeY domain-containing protein [Gemmatimonadetes bacterium]|nr:GatB/YqeY domain-containing protein [Gemmatimonadota bacterium]
MAETSLKDQLRADLNAARKERDKLRTTVLTTFISEIRNREIELGRQATDEDLQPLLTTAIKRRREAAEQMRGGGLGRAGVEGRAGERDAAGLPPAAAQ